MLRGVLSFIDSLVFGMSTLMYSASFFEDEEEAEKEKQAGQPQRRKKAKENAMMGGTVVLSVVLAVAIFMILPYYLSVLCSRVYCERYGCGSVRRNPASCNFYRIYIADLKNERDSAGVHVSRCGA